MPSAVRPGRPSKRKMPAAAQRAADRWRKAARSGGWCPGHRDRSVSYTHLANAAGDPIADSGGILGDTADQGRRLIRLIYGHGKI